jgi:hypothetical protein
VEGLTLISTGLRTALRLVVGSSFDFDGCPDALDCFDQNLSVVFPANKFGSV